jgi:hypothetical protein
LVLEAHLRELGIDGFKREFAFMPERRWRFDYADQMLMIAIEIEGGIFTNGRHVRGSGYQRDLDKYNAATARGWRVFRFSVEDVLKGRDIEVLKAATIGAPGGAGANSDVAIGEDRGRANAASEIPDAARMARVGARTPAGARNGHHPSSSFLLIARNFAL